MMLRQVLQELESATGPVELNALSRKLGVERGALEGMIEFWMRKGRLKDAYALATEGTCVSDDCAVTCSDAHHCPLVTKLPRSLSLLGPHENHPPE
jgi:hypothetical protein